MRTLENSRKYEVLVDGMWVPVHWEQLDKGDTVRCNPPLPEDVYHDAAPFVVEEQPGLKVEKLEVVMKAQLMMDEDVVTVEDLIEKHKISVSYKIGDPGDLPTWTAIMFTRHGVNRASAVGRTLRDAVEGLIKILPLINILPEDAL